jgi:transposase-like protein
MVREEKKFYSKEFKERTVCAYRTGDESLSVLARRFGINIHTYRSWIYPPTVSNVSPKINTFVGLNATSMQKEKLSPEAMEKRINELEHYLSIEKMRTESLTKMIEPVERELQIDIRKKTGAKQSLR